MDSGFEEYVRARGDALRRFAYVLCGDRHHGEDLVQEVLVKAYRRWSRIETDQPDRYLRTALVRTHISWLRRLSNTERPAEIADDRAATGAGAEFADRQALRDDMWARLAELTRTQRAVLVLRYYEDLDDQQIAEIVRCAPGTVRVHASRGLAKLRTDLDPAHPTTAGAKP
ncbi:LuxR family transcriptional regulator [Actinoplanes sp. SE50]|uniref:SigE family RNA polymerase sigma factor n=1 Tax=unclassified Actinoplanes TaxID=2626549 RepID=UPI00023EBD6F|nr:MULTISPECIES: SigE family RNA polymerase sigma factor [unclassified Actinoplanes]AEV85109.1 RNA polymerase sigma-E factor [Actinoplanes sp. SE50/110]ATO83500.1 LuxR family transcriptional regulator [Actinoplanes sp. SE50]SLM00907.1 LuxR family transcriptional regulator [Actinoplanes sp. SE50/110]